MGFHWDVFAKVNAMVCVFGLITYALANHADSVTLKPDGRADDSWGAYLTQFLWSYLGAMIRNGCLVAAMTILTRNQTPLRVIDHALESSSSITTDAADAAGYNAPLVASRTDSVHGTDAKTAAKCAPAAVPAPTSSAAAIGASDAAPKRKAASLKQRPVPTVRENIEMSLRMLLIACSFEALAALIAEHGRGFASYPSPFEGGAAELGSTLAAISGAVVSGDLHSAVRVASASWWWPVVTYVPHLFMFEVCVFVCVCVRVCACVRLRFLFARCDYGAPPGARWRVVIAWVHVGLCVGVYMIAVFETVLVLGSLAPTAFSSSADDFFACTSASTLPFCGFCFSTRLSIARTTGCV